MDGDLASNFGEVQPQAANRAALEPWPSLGLCEAPLSSCSWGKFFPVRRAGILEVGILRDRFQPHSPGDRDSSVGHPLLGPPVLCLPGMVNSKTPESGDAPHPELPADGRWILSSTSLREHWNDGVPPASHGKFAHQALAPPRQGWRKIQQHF